MVTQHYEYDGETRAPEEKDLIPGLVLRSHTHKFLTDENPQNFRHDAFSDCVIVAVYARTKSGEKVYVGPGDRTAYMRSVLLARPYIYVSGSNTACPTVLTGVEQFEVSVDRLLSRPFPFRVVLLSTGEPTIRTT